MQTASVAEEQDQEGQPVRAAVAKSDALPEQILALLQKLQQSFEVKLQYDEAKDKQIDRLHEELRESRDGLNLRILRPLFLELISLYDDVHKYRELLQAQQPHDALIPTVRNLDSFEIKIDEMLRRAGVEKFTIEEQVFRGDRQRSFAVRDTPTLSLDKQIAARLRPGFLYEGKVLRPEWVETYRYVPGSSPTVESVG
ncbi:MAG: nucleotide exchange factor GrpE [Ktedonobacterales bacterium]